MEMQEEIQEAKDPNNKTELEQKHVPVVEVLDGKVRVKVGEIPHVMTEEHYIEWIEIFDGDKSLGKKELGPGAEPVVEFEIKDDVGKLRALESCNLHGVWEGEERLPIQEDE